MDKVDIIGAVAEATGKPKVLIREVLDATAEVVRCATARREEVFLFGVGKLRVSTRAERPARDLHTGARVMVPERNVVLFRPSASMLAAANGNGS
jgi:DNA-binding protein HU-beta